MAEETGRSSDNLTQQSQEKSRWRKFKSWLLDFLGPCMVWLVGGTLGLSLFLSCLLEAMAVAWPIVKAGNGFSSYDIICIGCLAFFGVLGAYLCGCCGRNIVRLIQSSSGKVAVCLKKPVCWAPVMIAASCGSACSMLFLSSLTAPSLSSLRAFLSSFSWPWIGWVLLLDLFVFVLSVVLWLLWRPVKEWMGKLPLFMVIAIWVVLAIIASLSAMSWLGRTPFWQVSLDHKKQAKDIIQIALTIVGGVSAVTYLVIKYQERQQAGRAEKREKDRIVDTKMQDAINQLGSDKASTRIAGVYALTDIADTYRGGYRQRVVDILCGYLRSDRANYALDELGQPVKNASGYLIKSGASDEAVESTILSVMRDRLRKERKDDKTGETTVRQTVDDDQLWCACTFDLHEATFHEAVDLTDSTFECVPYFRGTKFERDADFRWATFTGNADFRWAIFTGNADFHGATFTGDANFYVATFKRDADFHGATFTGNADFIMAIFTGNADFRVATFTGNADFRVATFKRGADFRRAEFRANAAFSGIQGKLLFEECKFNEKFRDAYEWGPIPIPGNNDGLPAGAVWEDF